MNKRIAVTGREGRLDKILVDSFGCLRLDANICDKKEIHKAVKLIHPDVIINCASFTAVDDAEMGDNRLKALHVNSAGIANLRDEFDGQLIHISTDYIFNGKSGPYNEKAEPDPINWYGQTKLCGEERLQEYNYPTDVIVRTTVLYGGHKPDFASVVLRKLKDGYIIPLPNNLFGSPTHIFHLAKGLMALIELEKPPKIINIAGSDVLSRYEFGLILANVFGYSPERITPKREQPGVAKRPQKAGLKVELAKKLKIPIYTTLEGVQQLFLERANIYGDYPIK